MIAALAVLAVAAPAHAKGGAKSGVSAAKPGELILHQGTKYNGDTEVITRDNSRVITDWNVGSISLYPGEKWEICAKARFKAPCMVLDRSIPVAKEIGIEGSIGSARKAK
ncbi:MAG TPA: hypothetical protein VHM92_03865 [Allosphingosinicella sp.]|nr:hypothetical protein [Allosphingosinicella sp.]